MAQDTPGRALNLDRPAKSVVGSTLSRWQSNWQSDDTKCYGPTERVLGPQACFSYKFNRPHFRKRTSQS